MNEERAIFAKDYGIVIGMQDNDSNITLQRPRNVGRNRELSSKWKTNNTL